MNNNTDCGVETKTSVCVEHNVKLCWVCIKARGLCNHGGCHTRAAFRVRCIATVSARTVEVRPLCVKHTVDFTSRTEDGRWSFEATSI